MADLLARPPVLPSGGDGYLSKMHFQVAYVTSDLERAKAVFSERFGITGYTELGGEDDVAGAYVDTTDGDYLKVALAWAGGTMYELIEARGPSWTFYHSRLPAEDFAIRHHHLGYLLQTEEEWQALTAQIEHEGREVLLQARMPNFMSAIYIDAPELGHYLEYILPDPEGVEFFSNVPKS
jgi:hypothetical protein